MKPSWPIAIALLAAAAIHQCEMAPVEWNTGASFDSLNELAGPVESDGEGPVSIEALADEFQPERRSDPLDPVSVVTDDFSPTTAIPETITYVRPMVTGDSTVRVTTELPVTDETTTMYEAGDATVLPWQSLTEQAATEDALTDPTTDATVEPAGEWTSPAEPVHVESTTESQMVYLYFSMTVAEAATVHPTITDSEVDTTEATTTALTTDSLVGTDETTIAVDSGLVDVTESAPLRTVDEYPVEPALPLVEPSQAILDEDSASSPATATNKEPSNIAHLGDAPTIELVPFRPIEAALEYNGPSIEDNTVLVSHSDQEIKNHHNYGYQVKDTVYHYFAHHESDDGKVIISGSYIVRLPDGRIQTVRYKDDGFGYVAEVEYEGVASS